jgi:hypothetical protein
MSRGFRFAGCLFALGCLWLGCAARSSPPLGATQTVPPSPEPRPAGSEPVGRLAESGGGHTRPIGERERLLITELMRAAERVRGLRFVRSVPVWVQDRDAIMGYARDQFDRDELERATALYTALDLLPAALDLRDLLVRLLGEQIIGYYDDKTGQLFVRDEIMHAFERAETEPAIIDLREARMTLVHELVHALQDQHLGLSGRLASSMDTDAENAFKALYEGDAMLAMMAFSRLGPSSELVSSLRRPPLAQTELDNAPAIVRIPLVAAYLDGLAFCAQLFAQGGWASVDRAYGAPPESTEQILHPTAPPAALAPAQPRIPDAEAALGTAYELWFDDTLGELELSVYFGIGLSQVASRQAAAGWGGDRIYAYRPRSPAQRSELALLWLTSWDSDAEAREAQRAAERAQLRSGRGGSASVDRAGRSLLISLGVPPQARARVREEFPRWPLH